MVKDTKEILIVTGVFLALNIGAGFTSGQEILQFFSGYGWIGIVGSLIALIIMIYGGESIIDGGWTCRNNPHISVFEYFGGPIIGNIYNYIVPFAFYGSYIIMITGAGAVLEQYFNIPNVIGRIIAITLSVVSIFLHFEHIAKFLGYIAKGISFVILVLCIVVIGRKIGDFSSINTFFQNNVIPTAGSSFYGAGSLYAGTIVLASSQFLFELGSTLKNRNSGVYGITIGALGFVGVLLIINLAILLYISEVSQLPIITIYFANLISPIVAFFIAISLFIAMYSASTTCLWSVSNIIRKKFSFWRIRYITVVIFLGVGCVFLSALSFEEVVRIIYPINGFFGLCLVLMIIIHNRYKAYSSDKSLTEVKEEHKE